MDERLKHLESQVSLAKANLERELANFEASRTETDRRRRAVDRHIQIIREIRALKANLEKLQTESAEIVDAESFDTNDPAEKELQMMAARLRNRLKGADKRWRAAREITATPIDDLQADELRAEEAEASLREAEAAATVGTPKRGELTLERLTEKVKRIEEENVLRSEELSALKYALYRQTQKKPSATVPGSSSVPRSRPAQPDDDLQIGKYLDSVYEKLQQRNIELQSLTASVDEIEGQWRSAQSQLEKSSWTQKMERIESLNQGLSDQDYIYIELQAIESESSELRRTSLVLQERRISIDRQFARLREERQTLECTNISLDSMRRNLERRRVELGLRATAAALRRASVADAAANLARLQLQRRALKRKIEAIEERTKETELTATILFEQIENESADLSVLTLELRHAQRRVRRSLQDEPASSILEYLGD
jgi:chromosome segregation ATPase